MDLKICNSQTYLNSHIE